MNPANVSDAQVSSDRPIISAHVLILCCILMVHVVLLAWAAYVESPAYDEWWHLPSGIAAWREGRHDLYRINPPLTRLVAALPVLPLVPDQQADIPRADRKYRSEVAAGTYFAFQYGAQVPWWVTIARWACIPFSILGAMGCYWSGRDLYGVNSGLLATTLWCFCPNILGNAHLIVPDASSAALGIVSSYAYWKWLRQPTWPGAAITGVLLALTLLTKLTWIILFILWPALWCLWFLPGLWKVLHRRNSVVAIDDAVAELALRQQWISIVRSGGQLLGALVLAVIVLNGVYDFRGSMKRLDSFDFISASLRDPTVKNPTAEFRPMGVQSTNRFTGTLLGWLPVPFPEDYVLGIDRAKYDFEEGWWSYFRGEWRRQGWWYYYLYAAAIKVPLGTWVLGGLALCLSARKMYRGPLWGEVALFVPGIAVFVFVSSQVGFSHHLRYALPAFPFAYIWCSKVARGIDARHYGTISLGGAALVWSIASSLSMYPHSLSYFNELVGAKNGHWYLDKSNTDWGQELFGLKKWYEDHPDARPLNGALDQVVTASFLGFKLSIPAADPRQEPYGKIRPRCEVGPFPGWYVVSVNELHLQNHDFDYFLDFEPVDWIGNALAIYHITPAEANRVRVKLGLPEIRDDVPSL